MRFYRRYRPLFNLLGLVLLVALIVLFKIDLAQTLASLARANPLDLAFAILLFVFFLASKAWRWQIILRDLGINIGFGEANKLYALGLGAGMVTPGQIGDAVKIAYLRERGLGRATLSVVLDRLWDLLILLLLTTSGAFVFWNELQGEWLAVAALLVATLVLLAFALSPRAQHFVIERLVKRFIATNISTDNLKTLTLDAPQIARQFLLTLLATAVVYLRLYLLAHALGLTLAPIPFIATMSLASVATLIPISISGVGTRDAALLLVAPIIGITREQALGLSALILLLSVINGLVGYVVWSVSGEQSVVSHPESERMKSNLIKLGGTVRKLRVEHADWSNWVEFQYTDENGRTNIWKRAVGKPSDDEMSKFFFRFSKSLEREGWHWDNSIGGMVTILSSEYSFGADDRRIDELVNEVLGTWNYSPEEWLHSKGFI